jgi:transposase
MLISEVGKIYLASTPVDLRKSYQTLGMYVKQNLSGDPLSGNWFVFYNKRCDLLKILYWHTNGFCLWQKRIEKGIFKIPKDVNTIKKEITTYQLHGLIQGLEWQSRAEKKLHYRLYC